MFISVEEISIERIGRSRHSSKRFIICECDICHKQYTKKYTKKLLADAQQKLSFCNTECTNIARKKGGILMIQTQSHRDNVAWHENLSTTMNERYGVDNPGQMSDHVDKCAKTLKERYGVTNALQLPQSREACQVALSKPESIQKRKETNVKHWGSENVFGSHVIQERIKLTLIKKYGVQHSSHIEGVHEKKKTTYALTHDYNHPFKDPIVKEKARHSMMTRYGSHYYLQSQSFKQLCKSKQYLTNRHETMKRNGTYGKSSIEDKLYQCLVENFKVVERQAFINGWSIDFYIKDIDTYVQLDGVYWHGLDRKREIIETSTSLRDKAILSTMKRDEKQNEWFNTNNKRLLRFTDKQSFDSIIEQIQLLSP